MSEWPFLDNSPMDIVEGASASFRSGLGEGVHVPQAIPL